MRPKDRNSAGDRFFSLPSQPARVQSVAMNDYDKGGRYLVKRAPAGLLQWLLANPGLTFHAWIDARRVVLPNQDDLTNDLVAAVGSGEALEALCLELESEARADALTRVLRYLVAFWTEPAGSNSLPVSCVSGVILDLTGHSPTHELSLKSVIVPGSRLELTVLRRHLADEDAAKLQAGVAAGEISPWLLGWVPLMRGGEESDIISQWRVEAERHFTDERDRADLGTLTLTFATLAGCRPAWDRGLRGWNMQTSPFLDEIRAEVRKEARAEGLAEGRQEGRQEGRKEGLVEGARTMVLRQGRQKFGEAPSRKEQQTLDAITDLGQLEALAARLLEVDSWAKLLGESE
jgi:hypothetical protein